MTDQTLPKPSAELIILGAGLIELNAILRELGVKNPDFSERLLSRIESDKMRQMVVRLRGPRMSEDMARAIDEAQAWAAQATVVAKALKRA